MTGCDDPTCSVLFRSRLTGVMLTGLLLAGATLNACDRGGLTGPERAAPERPVLALNPACAGSGGQTHADSVKTAVTWSQAGNPHRVNQLIHIEGAGSLRLTAGTLVCFGSGGGLRANNGGRLRVEGTKLAPVVLTAADLIGGWLGVHLAGTPSAASPVKNLRLEHTRSTYAFATHDNHTAAIDSTVFRQNQEGLYLSGWASSLRRSRVDTVTGPNSAVTMGRRTTFQQTVIRGAAGVGLAVLGTDSISLLGGRIEGSGGPGLVVTTPETGFLSTQPVRVTAGAGYPAQLEVGAFARIYSLSYQDSLLGNARDTVVVTGGTLWTGVAFAAPALPWRVTGRIDLVTRGAIVARPGATLVMEPSAVIVADSGGQVSARGTQAAPVRFTGSAWYGIDLKGTPWRTFQGPFRDGVSYLTNARIEGTVGVAVMSHHPHPVVIDSTVFRQNGAAAWLMSTRSRISRSRVDTTLIDDPAVVLNGGATLESTLIRGSAGDGLWITPFGGIVQSCEIRESARVGIRLFTSTTIRNCNLVNNAGAGLHRDGGSTAYAEDNWWGSTSGPTGPGGDGVLGPVDYTPWLTAPYVLPYVP